MSNPAVTIRHARNAIHLLVSGAVRDIEAEFAEVESASEPIRALFDELADELDQWEIDGCQARRLDALLVDMQAMLGNPGCSVAVRELLTKHDLNP
jgi:hypothetical protein